MFDQQEYIRRQLEEEQRHLEILQQQLLHEQAMLLVSVWQSCLNLDITFTFKFIFSLNNINYFYSCSMRVLAPILPPTLVPSVSL